jgi:hypothetical protein
MKLLQVFFKDKDGFCEIEHHCFYLEFGNISGENLITSEDLYDKLVSQKSKHGREETEKKIHSDFQE